MLYIKDVDAVVKRAVSAGGKLIRPVEDMFYGDRTGSVQDPFGHTWFIATHIEDVTQATIRKRAQALYSKAK
jgi:PhnB protein